MKRELDFVKMGKKKFRKESSLRKKFSGLSTHDSVIRLLEERLENPTREILIEHEFKLTGREFKKKYRGQHEADVLVLDYQKRYAYAIEVKTTNSKKKRSKARSQLEADRKYIKNTFGINRIFLFYAYQNERSTTNKGRYKINRIDNGSERR